MEPGWIRSQWPGFFFFFCEWQVSSHHLLLTWGSLEGVSLPLEHPQWIRQLCLQRKHSVLSLFSSPSAGKLWPLKTNWSKYSSVHISEAIHRRLLRISSLLIPALYSWNKPCLLHVTDVAEFVLPSSCGGYFHLHLWIDEHLFAFCSTSF